MQGQSAIGGAGVKACIPQLAESTVLLLGGGGIERVSRHGELLKVTAQVWDQANKICPGGAAAALQKPKLKALQDACRSTHQTAATVKVRLLEFPWLCFAR